MTAKQPLGIVIAVGNAKGGVGKTTVTVHLAAALGLGGYRCLIIDLDAAAGATKHLGVAPNGFAGTLELLTTREPVHVLAIADNMPANVELIPSRAQLSELDVRLSRFIDRTTILDRPLAEAREHYDFILLDTAPAAAETTTVAAYASADWFLLSAFPHPLSLAGMNEALLDIAEVRCHCNRRLEVLGVAFSNVDGRATRLRAELEQVVGEALPGRMFETHISQAVILPELSGRGVTLFQDGATMRLPVAQQYLRLAAEVEQRVLNREAFLAGNVAPLSTARCRTPHAPELSLTDVMLGWAT
ncbi:MAG: ParA family protein [Planctomycetia bacterium]|nr:MAG: ParA family protein [Planctomycetia bacterium]